MIPTLFSTLPKAALAAIGALVLTGGAMTASAAVGPWNARIARSGVRPFAQWGEYSTGQRLSSPGSNASLLAASRLASRLDRASVSTRINLRSYGKPPNSFQYARASAAAGWSVL